MAVLERVARNARAAHGCRWLCLGLALISVVLLQAGVAATEGPLLPCGAAPRPPYPALGEPERTRVWTASELGEGWQPPECTGWTGSDFKILVALAGRFRASTSADQLLARFGAISALVGTRYWSATDQQWRELITAAVAINAPEHRLSRADFSVDEMKSGRDLYFTQRDNRSAGDVVYRMRVLHWSPERIVVSMENVTGVRFLLLTLFPPGALQYVHIAERQSDDGWTYYSLLRTRSTSSVFSGGFASSYANRAVAFYRHIAQMPEDRAGQ